MHSDGEQHKKLIKDFLEFGTANGFGDLSMLVPWLFKAEKASHSHLIEEVEKLERYPDKQETETYHDIDGSLVTVSLAPTDYPMVKLQDVISLLKRKNTNE